MLFSLKIFSCYDFLFILSFFFFFFLINTPFGTFSLLPHNWKFHYKNHLNLTWHMHLYIYLFILFPFITCLSRLNIFKNSLAIFFLSTQPILYRLSNFTSLHLFIPLKLIHFPYQTNSWLNNLIFIYLFSWWVFQFFFISPLYFILSKFNNTFSS